MLASFIASRRLQLPSYILILQALQPQGVDSEFIRSEWIESTFKSLWPRAKPRPTLTLLATSLTERCRPDQRLSRIGPAIRMGVVGVVDFQLVTQTGFKILDRIEITPFKKTTGQDAKPQLHLIEP